MKKNLAVASLIFAIAFLLGARQPVIPQNPDITPGQFVSTNPCKTVMSVSAAGQAKFCFGSDGAWVSVSGAPITQFAPAPAAVAGGVLSVNGIKPGVTGNIAIAIPAPNITATAPAPVPNVTGN